MTTSETSLASNEDERAVRATGDHVSGSNPQRLHDSSQAEANGRAIGAQVVSGDVPWRRSKYRLPKQVDTGPMALGIL